ncbi:hypothetical protein YC2023_027222 [Brassica napus]
MSIIQEFFINKHLIRHVRQASQCGLRPQSSMSPQSPSWIRSGRLLQLRLAEELSDSDPKNSGGGSSESSLPVTLPLDSYASAHENPRQTHYPGTVIHARASGMRRDMGYGSSEAS